jgi:hypothetical protein
MMNTESHKGNLRDVLDGDTAILDSESAARSAHADLFAQALRMATGARRDGFPLRVQSFLEDFSIGTSDIVRVGPNVTFTRIRDSIVREFSLVSPGALEGVATKTSWVPSQAPKNTESMEEMIRSAIETLARQAGVHRQ